MRFDTNRLVALLPAVYRLRDEERGDLRALLAVLAEQIGVVEENLEQLYDDQFIDTCADWVIPYIGALLGNTPLYDGAGDADAQPRLLFPDLAGPSFVPRVALRARPDVAKTLHFRARKATRLMLEELAADVTGWAAHLVEFFELLIWAQCIRNHLRLFSTQSPDVRRNELLDRIDGAFDTVSHTVDVRPPSQVNGWYEMRNIGFFLWRLRSYEINHADAWTSSNFPYRFRANPLGIDAPLFTRPMRDEAVGTVERGVPGPIRQSLFRDDLRAFYDNLPDDAPPDLLRSISIRADLADIPPEQICPRDLTNWTQPAGNMVAIDVTTGRIAFGATLAIPLVVRVSYHYGFSADLGGGTYARSAWLLKDDVAVDVIRVDKGSAIPTLHDALVAWKTTAHSKKNTVIALGDDRTYDETTQLVIDPPDGWSLTIQADDHTRPHIRSASPIVIRCGDGATVTFSGLLIEGSLEIGRLAGTVRLFHSTLVPDASHPSVDVNVTQAVPVDTFRLQAAFSITGAIRLPSDGHGIELYDCIVDGAGNPAIAGPSLTIERTTVFGAVAVREMPMASESIFTDVVTVDRRQQGCVRFSFVPRQSLTPRRYRCQPDLEIRRRLALAEKKAAKRLVLKYKSIAADVVPFLVPSFTSDRYGEPGYAQLHLNCPQQIRQGAEDGAEMGAFCHLKQPQREANLRRRLDEYLPFGLQPAFIYVT